MNLAMSEWEKQFEAFLRVSVADADAGHDMNHILRVVENAKRLAMLEKADVSVVIPAAWLHDCVAVPKDSPLRKQASRLAAEKAADFLKQAAYSAELIPKIAHAIAAHSFSAGIPPETLEAKVVQDADRLDAIGAIGIARCLMVGAEMGRGLYDSAEPFPIERQPDDFNSTIDHFYTKLFKLAGTMQTAQGRKLALSRTAFMQTYLRQLGDEIGVSAEKSFQPFR